MSDAPTRLAAARRQKGWTREEVAEWAGFSITTLYRLERGLSENAPLWQYRNLALLFGVDNLDDILEDRERGWRSRYPGDEPPGHVDGGVVLETPH